VQASLWLAEALGVTPERLAEGGDDIADEDEALAAAEEARRRRKGKWSR
jgi:hypothetical protein